MTTNVYVDGPNVYYQALKDRPRRWLDVPTWCERLLPELDIRRVRYFTAWANPAQGSTAAFRQRIYLRALATNPKTSIHFGRCVRQLDRLRDPRRPVKRLVEKVHLKGVDVALAVALFADIFEGNCDTAVLVTSDTDLRPAIHVARDQGVRVGVINPSGGRSAMAMREDADFHILPPPTSYRDAQFPSAMVDRFGAFHVPPSWLPVPA